MCIIYMHELRQREQKLLELNNQIDMKNEALLKQLKTKSKLDEEIGQFNVDVDFNDNNDDEDDDLKFDYSNINPYDKESLKKSQRPVVGVGDSQLADSMQVDNNTTTMFSNNNIVRNNDVNYGEKLLKQADDIRKREAVKRATDNIDNETKVHELIAELSNKNGELETVKQHLKQAIAELDNREEQVKKLEDKLLRTNEESIKLTKELKSISEKYETVKQTNMETKRQLGGLEKQKQGAEREQSSMMKTQKKFESELAKRDQR